MLLDFPGYYQTEIFASTDFVLIFVVIAVQSGCTPTSKICTNTLLKPVISATV